MDFTVEKCRVSTVSCFYFRNWINLTKTNENMRSFAHFSVSNRSCAMNFLVWPWIHPQKRQRKTHVSLYEGILHVFWHVNRNHVRKWGTENPHATPEHVRLPLQNRVRSPVLGPFTKLQKVTISLVMSVRPFVRMEQTGSHLLDFHEIWYLKIYKNSVEKTEVCLKSGKNKRVFYVQIYVHLL